MATSVASTGGELYHTDFEAFPTGPNQWAGNDGWLGNSTTTGSHGISEDLIPGLGKTAYLGFNEPSSRFVSVYRNIDHDPVAENTATLEIESLFTIVDSTNLSYDDFYFSFYNRTGEFLAAILFSNDPLTFGIWRLDGQLAHDTGFDFTHSMLHLLCAHVDPHANRWSLEYDGLPIFTGAPFNATAKTVDFGPLAAEWQVLGQAPADHGDNFLLVADWRVTAVPPGEFPFVADGLNLDPGGAPVLEWTGEPGWDYQVEYADILGTWRDDLPDSFFNGLDEKTQIQFTDTSGREDARFYRIVRTVTP